MQCWKQVISYKTQKKKKIIRFGIFVNFRDLAVCYFCNVVKGKVNKKCNRLAKSIKSKMKAETLKLSNRAPFIVPNANRWIQTH